MRILLAFALAAAAFPAFAESGRSLPSLYAIPGIEIVEAIPSRDGGTIFVPLARVMPWPKLRPAGVAPTMLTPGLNFFGTALNQGAAPALPIRDSVVPSVRWK
jgi:hypothetical protein